MNEFEKRIEELESRVSHLRIAIESLDAGRHQQYPDSLMDEEFLNVRTFAEERIEKFENEIAEIRESMQDED